MASTLVGMGGGGGVSTSSVTRGRLARLLVPVALLAVVVGSVIGIRKLTDHGTTASAGAAVAPQHPIPVPISQAVEDKWGVRFTNALVEASGGVIELRYEIVDAVKAGKLHLADPKTTQALNMPSVIVESTGAVVKPASLMFHFHHGPTESEGRTYSIIYGNAGGAIKPGVKTTIKMSDGLKIEHVTFTD
jgi:hypothetical protein